MPQVRARQTLFIMIVCAALLLIAACTPTELPPQIFASPTVPATSMPEVEVVPNQAELESTLEDIDAPNPLVRAALKDLAGKLSIPLAQVEIVSTENVIWPDTSLGCPRPGMAYRQVPRDGMRILLQANGQLYHYHSGGVGDPFLCENPDDLPEPPTEPDPSI